MRIKAQVHNKARNYISNIKNVEALEVLQSDCSGFRGYNPGSPNLTIQSLANRVTNTKQAVDDANVAKSSLDKESNDRESRQRVERQRGCI